MVILFSVLKNKNFLFLFWGRFVTNIGDSIYSVASMWLVFELTKSSFYTGIAGALILLPSMFEFLVGPLVDKWKLKSIMVYTQLLQAILISLVPISYFLGFLNVWLVIIVMFLATCIEQIVYPAQQSAIPKILENKDLVSGNSLMTFAYQGTDIILIGISGLLISYLGAINIFIINVFTFIVACLLFRSLKLSQAEKQKKLEENTFKFKINEYLKELNLGRKFIMNSIIPKIIFPLAIVNFIFGMITAIMPEFSLNIGGEKYYGYFLATMSIAMLVGALLSNFFSKYPLGLFTIIGFLISSVAWFLSYWIQSPVFTVLFFGLAFIPISSVNILITSTLQGLIPEDMIGKVFAWYSSITALFVPIGSFIGGTLASTIGIDNIYGLGSVALLSISVYWLSYPIMRKIPQQMNIKADDYGLSNQKNFKKY